MLERLVAWLVKLCQLAEHWRLLMVGIDLVALVLVSQLVASAGVF